MKFGSREIANVVFRAKKDMQFGDMHFKEKQPVLYIDTAKTSTVEGAADATYANGGRGNPRLITWEGNKTVTFTVEDALLSPVSFAILSGAGLIHGSKDKKYDKTANGITNSASDVDDDILAATSVASDGPWYMAELTITSPITSALITTMIDGIDAGNEAVSKSIQSTGTIVSGGETKTLTFLYTINIKYVNSTYQWSVSRTLVQGATNLIHVHKNVIQQVSNGRLDLSEALVEGEVICPTAPIFIMGQEEDGSLTGELIEINPATAVKDTYIEVDTTGTYNVDFYVQRSSADVYELQINAEDFAGSYYVEAETLFRRQDGKGDLPAIFTLPNVKIQSNWTFSMSADGDPSTFTFTMDASPGTTYFDTSKKVLAVIQIVDDKNLAEVGYTTVMGHYNDETIEF